ncbi:MAG: hypothetical protein RR212_13160 [Bacteroidales bacterium]
MSKPKFKLQPVAGKFATPEAPAYYPVLVSKSTIPLIEIAEWIADRCSLTIADITSAVYALADELNRWLKNGHSVDLGPLGRFVHQVRGVRPFLKPEEVTNKDVVFRRIQYFPEAVVLADFRELLYQHDRSVEQLRTFTPTERQRIIMELRNTHRMIHATQVRRLLNTGFRQVKSDLDVLVEQGVLEEHYLERRLFYFFTGNAGTV